MGKQTRRRRQKNQQQPKNKSTPYDTINPNAPPSSTPTQSTIESRLRHGDPRTREAALHALSCSIFSPSLQPSSKKKQKSSLVTDNLLPIILERTLDSHSPTSRNATGCLLNYINFSPDEDESLQKLFRGGRHGGIPLMNRIKKLRWDEEGEWEVARVICQTLAVMVERGALEVDKELVAVVNECLNKSVEMLSSKKGKLTTVKEDILGDCSIAAARTLHSALDDNLRLIDFVSEFGSVWLTIMKNESLPSECRLHLSGLVTNNATTLQQQLSLDVVNLWISQLSSLTLSTMEELMTQWTESRQRLEKEESDEQLEREAIRRVERRKEPAREIARRQAQLKKDREEAAAAAKAAMEEDESKVVMTEGDVVLGDMDVDDDNNNTPSNEKKSKRDWKNAREEFDYCNQRWKKSLSAVELTLEIATNACTLPSSSRDDDGDVDMTDSSSSNDLFHTMISSMLPKQTLALYNNLLNYSSAGSSIHEDLLTNVNQLRSKTGMLFVTMVSRQEDYPTGKTGGLDEVMGDENALSSLWKTLISLSRPLSSDHSAMMRVLYRTFSKSRSLLEEERGVILSLLTSGDDKSDKTDDEEEEMMTKRDGIVMLSEWGKGDRSVDCHACIQNALFPLLLSITKEKQRREMIMMIMNEVLNALMDIYAEDDITKGVVGKNGVMEVMEQVLPKFEGGIIGGSGDEEEGEEEREVWMETCENVRGFLEYKRGVIGC